MNEIMSNKQTIVDGEKDTYDLDPKRLTPGREGIEV